MADVPRFGVYDGSQPVEIYGNQLPHWFRPGTSIFVTFRTNDSLPRAVVESMQLRLEKWLADRGLPLDLASSLASRRTPHHDRLLERLSSSDRAAYFKMVGQLIHRSLDDCHGACHLRNPVISAIVSEHLLHFDGSRYDLDCFVVMPNHVHAIVQFRNGSHLNQIGRSWLQLSARRINAHLGLRGAFWQREPFDHLIRTDRQFTWLRRYIAKNPQQAGLRSSEFVYYPPRSTG